MTEPSAFIVGAGVVVALAPKGLGSNDMVIRFVGFLLFIVFVTLLERILP